MSKLLKIFLSFFCYFFIALHAMNETSFEISDDIHCSIMAIDIDDNKVVIALSNKIKIWDTNDRSVIGEIINESDASKIVDIVLKKDKVVAAFDTGDIKVWDISGEYIGASFNGGYSKEKVLKRFHRENGLITVCDESKNPAIPLLEIRGDVRQFGQVGDRFMAVSTMMGWIKLWDLKGTLIFEGRQPGVTEAFIFENRLVSVSFDRIIKIWDISNGRCLRTLKSSGDVYSIVLKGKFLAAGLGSGKFQIWCDNVPDLCRPGMCSFAACLHPRCGKNSVASVLSQWLLKEIGQYVIPEPWAS